MTNCQSEKSNSRPTGIGNKFEFRVPAMVPRALIAMPIGSVLAELKKKMAYNHNMRKRDTKVYRGVHSYSWIARQLQIGTSLGRHHNLVGFQS